MIITYKKRNISLIILFSIFLFVLFSLPIIGLAATEAFVPLTEGGVPGVKAGTSFTTFLNAVFKLGLAVAATLAVVMITIGGLEYMTTDSVFGKSEGRERIQNAIVGLLLALLIWLILFTINPNLLKFDVNLKNPNLDSAAFSAPSLGESHKEEGGVIFALTDEQAYKDGGGSTFRTPTKEAVEQAKKEGKEVVRVMQQGEGTNKFRKSCTANGGAVEATLAGGTWWDIFNGPSRKCVK